MSEEEKEELHKLKSLFYTNSLTQYGKRRLIKIYEEQIQKQQEEIKEKNKIIDEMAKAMINYDCFIKDCKHYAGENGKLCEDCIKEYFTLLIYTKKEV